MRYNSIDKCECINGTGVGVSLYVQGCSIHCENCFNPETWDFLGGQDFTAETFKKINQFLNHPYITRFSILGGEPLESCNWKDLYFLISGIKDVNNDIPVWVYTGYTYKYLQLLLLKGEDEEYSPNEDIYYLDLILNMIDVLVAGPFIDKEKDKTLPFRGGRNQKIIDMQKTKKMKRVVTLYGS